MIHFWIMMYIPPKFDQRTRFDGALGLILLKAIKFQYEVTETYFNGIKTFPQEPRHEKLTKMDGQKSPKYDLTRQKIGLQ